MIIPLLDAKLEGLPDWSLGERDEDVIAFLGEEEFRFFTFEGLKRRLGLHPETLSRILGRLEAEGIVQKSSEGYMVKKEVASNLRFQRGNSRESRVMLLQTFLPSDLSADDLVLNLRGRWFGLLRWLGLTERSESVELKWVTEDGSIQLDAKVTLNTLSIEARFLRGFDKDLALKAAYQLMNHIGRISASHRNPVMARHVGYFGFPGFYLVPE